jgi:hypothetical protein
MKKFIFIPVVNNFHLLEKAIDSVPPNLFDEYIVFDNSEGKLNIDLKHFSVVIPERRMTFRETQNIMRKYAIENNFTYYSFMHNDGEITDDSAQRLVYMADDITEKGQKWSVIFTHYDVFCVYNTECVKAIGEWGDDMWPSDQQSGYFLDNDYYRRMRLSEYTVLQLSDTKILHNEPSNTIQDKVEYTRWEMQRGRVVSHYISKWGGPPGQEHFTKPFGDV